MPIYEYICNQCSHKFEAMRSFSQADASVKAMAASLFQQPLPAADVPDAPAATALTADINYFY